MAERLVRRAVVTAGLAVVLGGCATGGESPEKVVDPSNCFFNTDGKLRIGSQQAKGETETPFPGGLEFSKSPTGKSQHTRLLRPFLRANSEGTITAVGYPVKVRKVGEEGEEGKPKRPIYEADLRFVKIPKGSRWVAAGPLDANNVPAVRPSEVGCNYTQTQLASGAMQAIKPEGVGTFRVEDKEVSILSWQMQEGSAAGDPRSETSLRSIGAVAAWVNEFTDSRTQVYPKVAYTPAGN